MLTPPPLPQKKSMAYRFFKSLPALGVLSVLALVSFGGGATAVRTFSHPAGASKVAATCGEGQFPTKTICADLASLTDAGRLAYFDTMVGLYTMPVGAERTEAVRLAGTKAAVSGSAKCAVGSKAADICVGMLPESNAATYRKCLAGGAGASDCAAYAACTLSDAPCGATPSPKASASSTPAPTVAPTQTPTSTSVPTVTPTPSLVPPTPTATPLATASPTPCSTSGGNLKQACSGFNDVEQKSR